jgi:hypothetical protein
VLDKIAILLARAGLHLELQLSESVRQAMHGLPEENEFQVAFPIVM